MIENSFKQPYDLSNSLILSGAEVTQLPEELLDSYYREISEKLAQHKETMNQYSPEQLQDAVQSERCIVAINAVSSKLLGFAQIKRDAKERLELSSWLGWVPGIGRPILMGGAALADDLDPKAPVVARVREGNYGAKKVIKEMGGLLIGYETSEYPNPNTLQPYQKEIYDVSLGALLPTRPLRTKLEVPKFTKDSTDNHNGFWNKVSNNAVVQKLRWAISNYLPKHKGS